ncbi:small conductance mechanosensitive channel [Gracilibacillus orientalis]|uniref:Small conductance mechanosensitive channel n=1 Tax=Gracilibacillus orientalis TaxID=334253 RepID=A0A1I4JZE9_9BACI|nr:mechanosensitive ion channel domain-containing protein [Gracilibacillus orientalis]SFL71623.1 small conductance mechanosensitive channel [Gracilibacillus orientalis]
MDWINLAIETGKTIAFAIITLIVGLAIIKIIMKIVGNQMEKSKLDESLKPFLQSMMSIILKILLIISVISILGADITSFAAIIAAAGFAVGLAFQGSLANFAGGILLLTLRPFRVGDYIEGAGYGGTVKAIQILYTELTTPDNKVIFIPNGGLSNAGIVNYSVNSTRRVDFTFGVGYETDAQHVLHTLENVVNSHSAVLQDPEPFIRLSAHGDSAVEYTVRVWANAEDYWDVHFDILEQVKIKFDQENISIPYPQMDVHVSNQ